MKVLVIIDMQNDFMPSGALPVPEGDKIVPLINALQDKFDLVIATQDWHPVAHASFASSHEGKNVYELIDLNGINQILWPDHCIQGSFGAEFHSDLDTTKWETIFRKGTNPEIDSYSGFYDNAHLKSTGLAGYLKEKGASELYFCGLAAEYCVYFSVKDALQEGFKTVLIEDATKALSVEDFEKAKLNVLNNGGRIVQSKQLLG